MNKQYEEKAMMADMVEAEKVAEFSPSGSYKKDSLNRLIRSVNEMLKHFNAPMLAEVDRDVEGPLPVDLVKALNMINSALEDAKIDEYKIDMKALESDRDLMMARGKIDTGAKDRAFIAFLAKPIPQGDTEVAVSVEVEEEVPPGFHRMPDGSIMSDNDPSMKGGSYGEVDEEELFMSRMA